MSIAFWLTLMPVYIIADFQQVFADSGEKDTNSGRFRAFYAFSGCVCVTSVTLRDRIIASSRFFAANPQERMCKPSFLAVIVGMAEYARTMPEGVHVIPIRALGA